MMRRVARLVLLLALVSASELAAGRTEIVFPAPNKAWTSGRLADFVQHTVSGDPESGLFGCVRSGGTQFHEGLDIQPTARDRRGEATDLVFAAMDGIVRHVSSSPGRSSYGRYIVMEHPDQSPAVYTLYAHLASIRTGVVPGSRMLKGQALGVMGRSAGGYAIPKDRAHLHFEIGLRLTDDFQGWYAWRKFGSQNQHGRYNGMNLMGIDPLDFLRQWRTGRVDDFRQYFDQQRAVVRVRVATARVPDFIQRYPALLRKPIRGILGGWEVECNATGIPFAWTPLSAQEIAGQRSGTAQVVWADAALTRATRCKQLVKPRRGGYEPGSDLTTMLQLVFGLR